MSRRDNWQVKEISFGKRTKGRLQVNVSPNPLLLHGLHHLGSRQHTVDNFLLLVRQLLGSNVGLHLPAVLLTAGPKAHKHISQTHKHICSTECLNAQPKTPICPYYYPIAIDNRRDFSPAHTETHQSGNNFLKVEQLQQLFLCFISSENEIYSMPFDITACHIINESMHRSFRSVGQILFRPHREARTADWKCRGDGGHDWLPSGGEMKRRRTRRLNKGEIEGERWSEITSHSHQRCHYSFHQPFP